MAIDRFESARAATARLKNQSPGLIRIVCGGNGKKGGPCPAMLGFAVFRDEEATSSIEEDMPERVWYAMRKDGSGYRMDENGDYLCGPPKKLRRPITESLSMEHFPNADDPYRDSDIHEYVFVGNWPILPVDIYCPNCGTRNFVPKPKWDYPWYYPADY